MIKKLSSLLLCAVLVISPIAYAQVEYDAHCKDLAERMTAVQLEMFDNRVPAIPPEKALSASSCLDMVLSANINIGVFFDLSALIDRLINKACTVLTEKWNSAVNKTRYDLSLNANEILLQRLRP